MPPAENPFAGLSEPDAYEAALQWSERAVRGLPRRPALPHEREEENVSWFFTADGFERYEERIQPFRDWWAALPLGDGVLPEVVRRD